ncbi:MAG TPA: cellulose biosynthesis cyclic di-GMP-binding regulatory protein BcsB [Chloroflexota bacterium]
MTDAFRRRGLVTRCLPILFSLGLLSVCSPAAQAQTQSPAVPGVVRLMDSGYNDEVLRGKSFDFTYFVPGPGEYPLSQQGGVLNLAFSASSLAQTGSMLVVNWNNVPLTDLRLENKDGRQTAAIAVPADRIDPAINRLEVKGEVQVDEGACRPDSPAEHVTIFKESDVHYSLADTKPHSPAAVPNLGRYPAPFFDPAPLAPLDLVFVVPENPGSGTLRSLAGLSAGLGKAAGSKSLNLRVVTDSGQLDPSLAQANVIFLGRASDLPGLPALPNLPLPLSDGSFGQKDGSPVQPDSGVLLELPSPLNPGRLVLVVSGATDAAVLKAATTLSLTKGVRFLGRDSAVIDELQPEESSASGSVQGGRRVVALSDLGREDQPVSGAGDHDLTFKLDLPGVPQGRNGLALNLVVSHSPLMDLPQSSMQVLANGIPVTSVGMKQIDATRATVQVNLPARALKVGPNTFDVVFTLRAVLPQGPVCATIPNEQAWAVLHSDSNLQLSDQITTAPTEVGLTDYPYPFVGPDGLAQTLFVVPRGLDATPFAQYLVDLGRSLRSDSVPPQVVTEDEFAQQPRDANVVIWGTPTQTKLLSQLNDYLPLTVSTGAQATFSFSSNLLLTVKDAGTAGVVEEGLSPWSPGRRVLVVSGTTPDSVMLAVNGLAQPGLADNLALITPATARPQALATPESGRPPVQVTTYKIRPRAQPPSGPLPFVSLPILLAAGLALLALVMAFSMAYQAFVRDPRSRR